MAGGLDVVVVVVVIRTIERRTKREEKKVLQVCEYLRLIIIIIIVVACPLSGRRSLPVPVCRREPIMTPRDAPAEHQSKVSRQKKEKKRWEKALTWKLLSVGVQFEPPPSIDRWRRRLSRIDSAQATTTTKTTTRKREFPPSRELGRG